MTLLSYLEMYKREPWLSLQAVASAAFIFALLFAALYLKEILRWVEGVL